MPDVPMDTLSEAQEEIPRPEGILGARPQDLQWKGADVRRVLVF